MSKIGFKVLETITVAHGEGDPLDLGFVLQLSEPKDIRYEVINMDDVEKVKRLYRKGLGFNFPAESVLKYNVEAIEHFYQTILLDSNNIIEPPDDYRRHTAAILDMSLMRMRLHVRGNMDDDACDLTNASWVAEKDDACQQVLDLFNGDVRLDQPEFFGKRGVSRDEVCDQMVAAA